MKLSEIKGERTLDVIADLIEPIATMAEDEEVQALFKREKVTKSTDKTKYVISRLRKGIPALIRNHKDELVSILSTINGVTPEEYRENISIMTLTRDVWDLVTDSEFLSLFTSAQSTESGSGSVPENTEGN